MLFCLALIIGLSGGYLGILSLFPPRDSTMHASSLSQLRANVTSALKDVTEHGAVATTATDIRFGHGLFDGKSVGVAGYLTAIELDMFGMRGPTFTVSDSSMPSNGALFDASSLSTEDRRRLLRAQWPPQIAVVVGRKEPGAAVKVRSIRFFGTVQAGKDLRIGSILSGPN